MNQYLKLKGTSEGFQLHLDSDRLKRDFLADLEKYFENMGTDAAENFSLEIYAHDIYLSPEEQEDLVNYIENNSVFSVDNVYADLLTEKESIEVYEQHALTIETGSLHSGQLIRAPQDLLFIGSVPQGAEVQAGGNIYIIGDFHGTAYAGRNNDAEAIIVCQFGELSQLRIDTAVHTFREEEPPEANQVAFINRYGQIEFQPINVLRDLRPDLNQLFSGNIPFEK